MSSRRLDRSDEEGESQAKRKHIASSTDPQDLGSQGTPSSSTNKMLGSKETALRVLRFLLDTSLVLSEGGTSGAPGDPHSVTVTTEQLPLTSRDMMRKLQPLFIKCASKELDVVRYCVACFERASQRQPQAAWAPVVWKGLSQCTLEIAASTTLQQLVEGASQDGDDLWSSLYGGAAENRGLLVVFLERLSGWSEDGVTISSGMLRAVLAQAKQSELGRKAIIQLVQAAGGKLKSVNKADELIVKTGKVLGGLEALVIEPIASEIFSEQLHRELQEGVTKMGDYFEQKSFLSGLMSVTTVIDRLHAGLLKDERYSCFLGLQNFPNVSKTDAQTCQSHVQDGLHRCQSLVHTTILKMLKVSNRSNVLGWLAGLVSLNLIRTGPRFKRAGREDLHGACSDGFMLNFCAVMLELCKPFFCSHPSADKLALISTSYPTSACCRLDLLNEPCLAQGFLVGDENLAKGFERFLPAKSSFKFVTECFFITQRALHVGVLPAIKTFGETMSDLSKQITTGVGGNETLLRELHSLYLLAWSCSLSDPQFVQYCSEFYITQSVWMARLMDSCKEEGLSEAVVCERQRKAFAAVPEFCVKDMAAWFRFVVLSTPLLLQGLQLTPFVDCCVGLLERPDLLPGPLAQSRLVSVLLAFVDSDKRGSYYHQRLLRAEGWSGGILGELSVMVQASPTVQDHLGPALLHTYAAVNVVEGLDVDKESFDKYATRYEIALLLDRLWARGDCRESILRECGSKKFQLFLGAVFDTLLYQLNDGLSRLAIVRKYESEKDGGQWEGLNAQEKHGKEGFLAGEKGASRGFISQASRQLELFHMMTEAEPVAKCLCVPTLAKRTAVAMLGFLDVLCGPRASELKVKDMEKYSFYPRKLVSQITSIIVRVWHQDSASKPEEGFVFSLATHPDFSPGTMTKCGSVLQQTSDSTLSADFAAFMGQVEKIQTQAALNSSGSVQSPSSSSLALQSPQQQLSRGGGGAPMEQAIDDAWQQQADAADIMEDGLRDIYVSALEESKYDSCELEEVHTLAEKAQQQALEPRSPRVRAILRDMKQLQDSLPVHPDAAIFIRQDEDHLDLVRVLITGPTGTPYSRGCFVFDVYFPASYPTIPPLVIMTTTGGGTVRFNPNLYADGKVCLSLLGTWHGGDATEKWDPLRSNILQVLLSIQGMIFISDPMFNEPGYEAIRSTPEGNKRSNQYNANIQVHTIRHAMLEQLRNPPRGFEDVIQVHFAIQRDAVLKQCSSWLQREGLTPVQEARLRKAVDEFRTQLDLL